MTTEIQAPEVPPPTTYRDVLLPLFGATALAEAEGRVYDRSAPYDVGGFFCCADGLCAMGVIARAAGLVVPTPHAAFPSVDDVITALAVSGKLPSDAIPPPLVYEVIGAIIEDNDDHQLAHPGALTTLLNLTVATEEEVTK